MPRKKQGGRAGTVEVFSPDALEQHAGIVDALASQFAELPHDLVQDIVEQCNYDRDMAAKVLVDMISNTPGDLRRTTVAAAGLAGEEESLTWPNLGRQNKDSSSSLAAWPGLHGGTEDKDKENAGGKSPRLRAHEGNAGGKSPMVHVHDKQDPTKEKNEKDKDQLQTSADPRRHELISSLKDLFDIPASMEVFVASIVDLTQCNTEESVLILSAWARNEVMAETEESKGDNVEQPASASGSEDEIDCRSDELIASLLASTYMEESEENGRGGGVGEKGRGGWNKGRDKSKSQILHPSSLETVNYWNKAHTTGHEKAVTPDVASTLALQKLIKQFGAFVDREYIEDLFIHCQRKYEKTCEKLNQTEEMQLKTVIPLLPSTSSSSSSSSCITPFSDPYMNDSRFGTSVPFQSYSSIGGWPNESRVTYGGNNRSNSELLALILPVLTGNYSKKDLDDCESQSDALRAQLQEIEQRRRGFLRAAGASMGRQSLSFGKSSSSAVTSDLYGQAKVAQQDWEAVSGQAIYYTLLRHNWRNAGGVDGTGVVDVHLLTTAEATQIVSVLLNRYRYSTGDLAKLNRKWFTVVHGVGHHSASGTSAIKKALIKFCTNENVDFAMPNDFSIKINM